MRGQGTPSRGERSRLADVVIFAGLFVAFWGVSQISTDFAAPFDPESAPAAVSTDPAQLPYYAARSLLRMFVALAFSVVFSFVYATIAARVRRAERIMIPILDVLQSVPVLGFLAVTLPLWIALFPGSVLGLESAAVFAIFTSQVWNMTFAFYQSLISQPRDLDEAARAMRLTRWQRFWKLDAPSGAFPLVWNGMMSFGGGWFFLIASEVFTVGQREYALPGIGSFAAAAAHEERIDLLLLAACVMVLLVIGVNVVFWRPLTAWAERFRLGDTDSADPQTSVVYDLLRRSAIPGALAALTRPLREWLDRSMRILGRTGRRRASSFRPVPRWGRVALVVTAIAALAWGLIAALVFVERGVGLLQFPIAIGLGLVTMLRVFVVLALGTIVWVPIGVWIGLSPRVTRFAQPVVQVLASFPANFLFPVFALALMATGVSLNVGGVLLMALGSQWYILFNVIAGAAAIPIDLRESARSLRLGQALTWRTLYGPAVFGSWVTGALTAAGGAWNASIVAEVVSYGHTTLTATGLGAYIAGATAAGDTGRVLVGVAVMSVLVVATNRLLWRRLYRLAETRYSLA
ncbi:ABC transporter permease [Leucobacter komagatae]|uniref:ABC transporter permease n=1 Tax=Leucobacter komagatae TaxID=55969 RepID=UPI000A8189DB|nr:ABC transporter permease subunit [Leucobacter komagatae]